MEKAIECVLFIDDDKATNFIHKFIANKTCYFQNVQIASSAREGLEYLKSAEMGENTVPNYIFLDINMPAMNGWDFLNYYEKQPLSIKEQIKIFMLSSSANTSDISKAKKYDNVTGYITKPLTEDSLSKVIVEKNLFEF